MCVYMRSALVVSPSLGAGPPPLPAATVLAGPGPPSPAARASPVVTVREADTPTADRIACGRLCGSRPVPRAEVCLHTVRMTHTHTYVS
eukprot:2550198-Prymnesium_polylepis.1